MSYLSEEQLAEMRRIREPGLTAHKEKKIRDLARDLHEGRMDAGNPRIAAALRELAGEIGRVLPS